ncbi:MAG: hypothetical protein BAJATHORv1_20488 [Candidatus Thorarchaeota archaeon]|nr:MAG: hypothetical protein BAJATHORv1_20488 [Candidatus Thorarchaeota archaeon]
MRKFNSESKFNLSIESANEVIMGGLLGRSVIGTRPKPDLYDKPI